MVRFRVPLLQNLTPDNKASFVMPVWSKALRGCAPTSCERVEFPPCIRGSTQNELVVISAFLGRRTALLVREEIFIACVEYCARLRECNIASPFLRPPRPPRPPRLPPRTLAVWNGAIERPDTVTTICACALRPERTRFESRLGSSLAD
jgi:hypothetical protein